DERYEHPRPGECRQRVERSCRTERVKTAERSPYGDKKERDPGNRHQRQHPPKEMEGLRMAIFVRGKAFEMMLDNELVDELPSVPKVHRKVPCRSDGDGEKRAPQDAHEQSGAGDFPHQDVVESDYREREYETDKALCEHRDPHKEIERRQTQVAVCL